MSEPSQPTPLAGGAMPPKKKTSPWVWVLVGCLGLVLVVLLLMGACGWFVANKVQEVAGDFEDNPAKATAVMAARLHPDLELIETDDEAGTITVRVESTGEVMTLDFEDMNQGRFRISSGEGETTVDFGEAAQGGGITVQGPDGEVRIGAAAGDDVLPAWLPAYPGGSAPQGNYSSTGAGQRAGSVTMTSGDSVSAILDYYEKKLRDAGLEVSKTTFTAQGSEGGMVSGNASDPQRTATVMVSDEQGERSIQVSFSAGG